MLWSEVSAKEGTGINEMFNTVAEKVCTILQNENMAANNSDIAKKF